MKQIIWRKEEIAIADELQQLIPQLRKEFLDYHTDFHAEFSKGKSYADTNANATISDVERDVWKVEGLRYVLPDQKVEHNMFLDPKIQTVLPTAAALTKKYFRHCGCSGYSILDAGGIIQRHTDIENRERKTVRIHVPLIIPSGETFFEVGGNEVEWTNIFAFDNEEPHSAYNNTKQRRLIYIIDINRSFLGIPAGEKFVPIQITNHVRKGSVSP